MKNNYLMLFAVAATLGLAACDTGEPQADASAPAAESSMSDAATEAADTAMGAIDGAVEAMDEMADDAMDSAAELWIVELTQSKRLQTLQRTKLTAK